MDHSNSSHCCLARLSCDDVKAEIKALRKRKSHKKALLLYLSTRSPVKLLNPYHAIHLGLQSPTHGPKKICSRGEGS